MYTIAVDLRHRLVTAEFIGFWDVGTVNDFGRDCDIAAKKVIHPVHGYSILCDTSRAAIQSQEVVTALQRLAIDCADTRLAARKLAFFSTTPLSRMQSRRICTARTGMAVFDDRDSAMTWLLDHAPALA